MTKLTPNETAALAELEWELSAPHTLEEIAEHLGCSLRTVSRVEARALAKMKESATDAWRGGLRDPARLHTPFQEIYPADGMTRPEYEE